MANVRRTLLGVIVGLVLLPVPVWADGGSTGNGCELLSPLFSVAGSKDVGSSMTTFVVSAQSGAVGCRPSPLSLSVNGLPGGIQPEIVSSAGGISAVIRVAGGPTDGMHDITYTVTDGYGNYNTITLPLRINGRLQTPNATPILDPIGNKSVRAGRTLSFTIGASSAEADLAPSENTLVIDGLPDSARVTVLRVTRARFAARVEVRPGPRDIGTYEVHVRAQDADGAFAISQFRLLIEP